MEVVVAAPGREVFANVVFARRTICVPNVAADARAKRRMVIVPSPVTTYLVAWWGAWGYLITRV